MPDLSPSSASPPPHDTLDDACHPSPPPSSLSPAASNPFISSPPSTPAPFAIDVHLPLPHVLKAHLLAILSSPSQSPPDLSLATLFLSLSLHLHPSSAAVGPLLARSAGGLPLSSSALALDWSTVLSHVHFIVQHFPFHSLSTLSSVLSSYLLRSDYLTTFPAPPSPSPISHVSLYLRLHLPSLPVPSPSSLPPLSHRLSLSSSALPPPSRDHNPWGYVDVLHEPPPPAPSAGLYLLHLEAGKSIPLHVHRVMSEAELVLSPGLLCQGESVPVGVGHRWGGSVHGYRNEGQGWKACFASTRPRSFEKTRSRWTGSRTEG